jgi:hypothetical protein
LRMSSFVVVTPTLPPLFILLNLCGSSLINYQQSNYPLVLKTMGLHEK